MDFLLGALIAAFFILLGQKIKQHLEKPYRWKCADCEFEVTTNHKDILLEITMEHMVTFHP